MLGGATQAMPLCIVEERQQRRRPLAAAPLRAAARRAAGRRFPLAALLAPHIPQGMLVARALPAGTCAPQPWGPAAKCKCYSVEGPKLYFDVHVRRDITAG